eukprot:SAG22_NODE_1196_length_5198_cov_3.167092_4_plen_149_part_00
MKPIGHAHENADSGTCGSTDESVQLAPFWHGLLVHSSMSVQVRPASAVSNPAGHSQRYSPGAVAMQAASSGSQSCGVYACIVSRPCRSSSSTSSVHGSTSASQRSPAQPNAQRHSNVVRWPSTVSEMIVPSSQLPPFRHGESSQSSGL